MEVALGILFFLGAFCIGWFSTIPEGYEDEDGFHYGVPDDTKVTH